MTILSPIKIVRNRRQNLWSLAADFNKAVSWVKGLEKIEYLRGNARGVGGVWRVHADWKAAPRTFVVEITEWLEGHRFALRPIQQSSVHEGVQLFQMVFDFQEVSESETRVTVLCEYEPLSKLARLRNLLFLRRHYLDLIDQMLDKLSNATGSQLPISRPHQ